MNKIIRKLIVNAKSEDLSKSSDALTDLGLLLERHTQNRYSEKDYLILFGNDIEIFEIRLSEEEVESIVNFLFFHIINININPITVAWCLGKCYNCNIFNGMKRLISFFNDNDEILLQLIYSFNALYDIREIKEELYSFRNRENLINTVQYVQELISEGII